MVRTKISARAAPVLQSKRVEKKKMLEVKTAKKQLAAEFEAPFPESIAHKEGMSLDAANSLANYYYAAGPIGSTTAFDNYQVFNNQVVFSQDENLYSSHNSAASSNGLGNGIGLGYQPFDMSAQNPYDSSLAQSSTPLNLNIAIDYGSHSMFNPTVTKVPPVYEKKQSSESLAKKTKKSIDSPEKANKIMLLMSGDNNVNIGGSIRRTSNAGIQAGEQGPGDMPVNGNGNADENLATGTLVNAERPARRNKVLEQIRRLQGSTDMLVKRAPFQRTVKAVIKDMLGDHTKIRFQSQALVALQEATEAYMIGLFEDTSLCALHANRTTIFPRDMRLARRLRGEKL